MAAPFPRAPLAILLLLGCKEPGESASPSDTAPSAAADDTDAAVAEGCGDGVVDPGEACDDGPDNDDTAPDACRTTCALPRCGDGVVDRGETCDDGNGWGGDGCAPDCQTENLRGEQEPNDRWWQANAVSSGESVLGALPEYDVDCWTLDVEDNGWVSARASGPDGACPPDLSLRLYGPDGEPLAQRLAADALGDCVQLGPATHPEAAYLTAGPYTVCVEGLLRSEVATYLLQATTGDDSCLDIEPGPDDDLDGDGVADACDPDIDGDGVPNEADVCPWVSDGPNTPVARTDSQGFLRHWLVAAGLRGDPVGPGGMCDPSTTARLGDDDATAVVGLGDRAGDVPLRVWRPDDGRIDFLDLTSASPDREAYAMTWLRAPDTQDAVLYAGVDDGAAVWVGDQPIGRVPTCQSVQLDGFSWPITLQAGWNRILFKIRDHGGGWGMVARLRTPSGEPLAGYEVSPVGPSRWSRDQADRDGDGVGDACDPEP